MSYLKNWPLGVILAILILAPLIVKDEYFIHILVMSGIFVILASSLNIILAVGQLNLGHTAFFGLGAFTSGLLSVKLGIPFWIGLPAAGLVSASVGYAIGLISLKMRGAYFVLVTIGFAEVMHLICLNWIDLTGGPMGLAGVAPPSLHIPYLLDTHFRGRTPYYYLILALVLITLYVAHRMFNSRLGRAFAAINQNESLAESIGISAFQYSLLSVVVATFFAGLAGSFYAHYVTFLSPDLFSFPYTVTIVIMTIVGGAGTLLGPVVGAVAFTILPELLRAVAAYRMISYGLLLILAIIFMPQGIVPALGGLLKRGRLAVRNVTAGLDYRKSSSRRKEEIDLSESR
ncbi:MAG: branched-chain amino acid ABC transporter permease [Chloroflexi bacterium]|nr:branched-chain amino acid ABC transporter permease [Chloroflexota bacterium]